MTVKTQPAPGAHEERRFRAIFDASPDCIKLVNADGCLVDMNRAGLRMIEADCISQVRGNSLFSLIDPAFHQMFRDGLTLVFAGKTAQIQFEVVGLRGRRLIMDQTAAPLFAAGDAERVVEMIAITRDITEQQRAEANLLQVRLAQEIARTAAHHVGTLGQKLKTPLQSIIGYTEMALEGAQEQGRERDAQDALHVLKAAEELSSLLNNMLRTTLVDTRKTSLATDVDDLIETAAATAQTLAEANGTRIKIEVDQRCTALPTEAGMLSQILKALLSHAAKNTRDGVITIEARPVDDNGPPRLAFTVTDTSDGLSPEQLKSVFDGSFSADGAGAGVQATVLSGLFSARKLAAFMGGALEATSALGQGSRFILEVPVRQAAAWRDSVLGSGR